MSNVNNYRFAEMLKVFESKVLIPQRAKYESAKKVMDNPNHPWKDQAQKDAGDAQYKSYKGFLDFYEAFYAEGLTLCTQHEQLTDHLSKWYDKWREDISNDGKQEVELMSSQADFLNEIFSEMYKELLPLNLKEMKSPAALNLK